MIVRFAIQQSHDINIRYSLSSTSVDKLTILVRAHSHDHTRVIRPDFAYFQT